MRKSMRRRFNFDAMARVGLFFVCMLFCPDPAALPAQSLEDIVALGDKAACTVADLTLMVPALAEAFPENADLTARMEKVLARYKPTQSLTKARASLAAAKGLRLNTSFFYILLPIQRYAFRMLVSDGIFPSASSGGDVLSGVDLLDFISMLTQTYGEQR
jgi:hypothetical protein